MDHQITFIVAMEVTMKLPTASLDVGTLAAGAGIALVAPVVLPLVAGVLKPVTKNVIKGSLLVYGKTKQTVAEAKASVEDMAAEAKVEFEALSAEARKEIAKSKPTKKKTSTAKA